MFLKAHWFGSWYKQMYVGANTLFYFIFFLEEASVVLFCMRNAHTSWSDGGMKWSEVKCADWLAPKVCALHHFCFDLKDGAHFRNIDLSGVWQRWLTLAHHRSGLTSWSDPVDPGLWTRLHAKVVRKASWWTVRCRDSRSPPPSIHFFSFVAFRPSLLRWVCQKPGGKNVFGGLRPALLPS